MQKQFVAPQSSRPPASAARNPQPVLLDNARVVAVVFLARVAFAVSCVRDVRYEHVPPRCATQPGFASFVLIPLSPVKRRRAGPARTAVAPRARLAWLYSATGGASTVVFRPQGWSLPIETSPAEILYGPTRADLPGPQRQGNLRQCRETRPASVAP